MISPRHVLENLCLRCQIESEVLALLSDSFGAEHLLKPKTHCLHSVHRSLQPRTIPSDFQHRVERMLHCLGRFACWVATVPLATRRLRLGNGCVDPTAVGLFAMMRAGHAVGSIIRLSHHESYGNHRPVCVCLMPLIDAIVRLRSERRLGPARFWLMIARVHEPATCNSTSS